MGILMSDNSKRIPHYLTNLKTESLPSKFISFDIHYSRHRAGKSGDAWQLDFLFGHVCRWRYKSFKVTSESIDRIDSIGEFWELVKSFASPKTNTWIVGFDLKKQLAVLDFFEMLITGRATIDGESCAKGIREFKGGKKPWGGYIVLEDAPNIVQFKLGLNGGTIKAIDVRNYGINSWCDISEAIGDQDSSEIEFETQWIADINLSKSRAMNLAKFMQKFCKLIVDNRFGTLKETIASQSYVTYRHKYLSNKILIHDNGPALKMERDSYYGGRCESRVLGLVEAKTDDLLADDVVYTSSPTAKVRFGVYHYDVNSLYPFVAASFAMPAVFERLHENPTYDLFVESIAEKCAVATVCVETEKPIVPVRIKRRQWKQLGIEESTGLSERNVNDSIVIYPVGRFYTTLCSPELMLAAQQAKIVEIISLATYKPSDLFSRFVGDIYSLRLQYKNAGDLTSARICKLILNSLYGKMGQRNRRWTRQENSCCVEPYSAWTKLNNETGEIEQWRSIAWRVEKLCDLGEHPQSCPVIAAYVASLARCFLQKMIDVCGEWRVFYYDTDSIFTTSEGAANLQKIYNVDNDTIGCLRKEGVYRSVDFRGYKYYVTPTKVVCAGLPMGSEVRNTCVADVNYARSVMADLYNHESPKAIEIRNFLPVPSVYKHGIREVGGRIRPHKLNVDKFDNQ